MAESVPGFETLLAWLNQHLGSSYPFTGVVDTVNVAEVDSFLARMQLLMNNLVITTDAKDAVVEINTWRSELKSEPKSDSPPGFVSLECIEKYKVRLMLIRDQLVNDRKAFRQIDNETCKFATGREPTANTEVTGKAWTTPKKDKERDAGLLTKRQLLLAENGIKDAKPLKAGKRGTPFFDKPVPRFRRS
jgi:hypothetical protein